MMNVFTGPSQCLKAAAPISNADVTVTWGIFGTIATYTCPPGWYFAEGGTRRTLVCTSGSWPRVTPMCTGMKCSLITVARVSQ